MCFVYVSGLGGRARPWPDATMFAFLELEFGFAAEGPQ